MRKRPLQASQRAAIRARFLDALGRLGNVTEAAKYAGVSKAGAYAWRQTDPEFAAAWTEAMELGMCALEDHAAKLAANGSEALTIFLLAANRPEKYQRRRTIEATTQDLRRQPLAELRKELAELLALAAADPQPAS